MNQTDIQNYYNILEVDPYSTIEQVRKAYRKLSIMYHPDKNSTMDATKQFQKINNAYKTICDLNISQKQAISSYAIIPKDMSTPSREDTTNATAGINTPLVKTKPTNISIELSVSMDVVKNGSTLPVKIERYINTPNSQEFENETLYVDIPMGIDDGEIITILEKGNINNNICGDVKIFIRLNNTTVFKRSGIDLIYTHIITLKEALCGFTFNLKHIDDKIYTIQNENCIISPNDRKIIPKMGLCRNTNIGNLIIIFDIVFPSQLTDIQINGIKDIL